MPVVALLTGLLASPATAADKQNTFYDASGPSAGTASTSGNVITFRDGK
jgi:hypothetical protein